eukprot:3610223-Ditylum_brightwellii.AAC.1
MATTSPYYPATLHHDRQVARPRSKCDTTRTKTQTRDPVWEPRLGQAMAKSQWQGKSLPVIGWYRRVKRGPGSRAMEAHSYQSAGRTTRQDTIASSVLHGIRTPHLDNNGISMQQDRNGRNHGLQAARCITLRRQTASLPSWHDGSTMGELSKDVKVKAEPGTRQQVQDAVFAWSRRISADTC